ncbi:MAG: methylated-DNA--[protein]-cysteine S-methyltransferase [Proteobacteria bacterium]|nr:methylated-DNA--[protein]-cysteine S-methyltransferase [Pseudomonadota bacterium]
MSARFRSSGSHRFSTAIGECAICWSPRGISALHLPDGIPDLGSSAGLETKAPAQVARAVEQVRRHLEGHAQQFDDLTLDLDHLPPFTRAVCLEARHIRSGEIVTYGELAARVGRPGSARAVGQALGRNPIPVIVPCHRIVAAHGRPGGFSAPGGLETKRRLLALEGVTLEMVTLWDRGAIDEAVRHLREVDDDLRRIIDAVGPCRLERQWHDVFEALCVSIIHQQLAGSAAAAITRRFMALLAPHPRPRSVLEAREADLRAVGLSSGKIGGLRALAEAAERGEVALHRVRHLPDDEITAHLTRVRGIGPWTVQMLLIFHLGRTDVLPPGDLGIRKAVQRLTGDDALPSPARMAAVAQRWRPWRTVAMWYLWRSLELTAQIR